MSSKTRLNVNMDPELKRKTAETLESLGLDLTTAVTIYFKQIVSKQRIPFEISNPQYYSLDDVVGEDWREGLEDLEDEWE